MLFVAIQNNFHIFAEPILAKVLLGVKQGWVHIHKKA